MNRTVLQIPVSTDLRGKAELEAKKQGFSSLQEAVRIFLSKLARQRIEISFEEPIQLSQKAASRYDKMTDEIKSGKIKLYEAKNVDDLMKQLNS